MKRNSRLPLMSKNDLLGWMFVLPAFLLLTVVLAFPIVYAIRMSFFNVSLDFTQTFVGIQNYSNAFKDPYFGNSIEITFIYTISSVLISLIFGMIVALILNANWIKGKHILNLIFLIPWTISFVVTATTWKWILNAQYGIFNVIFRELGLITANISFFGSPDLALPAVIFVNVWRNMPFAVVMISAGLLSIPEDQLEAALVDGASPLRVFQYVKLPNLRNVLSVTTVLLTIWNFIQFDLTKVLTDGGPNHATELMSNLIYRVSFNYYQFGYGSAIAVLMLIIVLILTVVYRQVIDHA